MTAMVLLIAVQIDMAYLQLSRTELRAATDAASKAAAVTLSQTQDLAASRREGIRVAGLNKIAGKSLVLRDSDFVFGNSARSSNGTFAFTPNATPYNGVKLTGALGGSGATSGVGLFFGNMHGVTAFQTQHQATSTYLERDIVLVIDRSGSMAGQKWKDLSDAIAIFVATVNETVTKEYMGLVSYSSTATQDVQYTLDLNAIIAKENKLVVGGNTSISAGISSGYEIIKTGRSKLFVDRTMVVMTDGQHNTGIEPIIPARTVAADGVVIHTITFGAGADAARMSAIASVGRGKYLHANNGDQLKAAFREIALTLSTMLTD